MTSSSSKGVAFFVLIVFTGLLITLQSGYLSRWWLQVGNRQAQFVQPREQGEGEGKNGIRTNTIENNNGKEDNPVVHVYGCTSTVQVYAYSSGSAPVIMPTDDDTIANLAVILNKKLSDVPPKEGGMTTTPCETVTSAAELCVNTTCPASFSSSPETRLRQILSTRNESLHSFKSAMAEVTRGVSASNKYVLVSAASANHYNEMQGMGKSVHTYVFPRLTNFTFIIFDLGLTPLQRNLTEKNCGCTVLTFPFDKHPEFFRILKCYSWKPMIIRSLIEKTEFLVWMDASIRWNHAAKSLNSLFQRCKERGLQLWFVSKSLTVRTDHEMFRFYGDQPCQYDPYGEIHSGLCVFYNEPFVRYAVLDPWIACGFTRRCMCVQDPARKHRCPGNKLPWRTGVCHRFDQSSLGIILVKLYGDRVDLITMDTQIEVRRGEHADWFMK